MSSEMEFNIDSNEHCYLTLLLEIYYLFFSRNFNSILCFKQNLPKKRLSSKRYYTKQKMVVVLGWNICLGVVGAYVRMIIRGACQKYISRQFHSDTSLFIYPRRH